MFYIRHPACQRIPSIWTCLVDRARLLGPPAPLGYIKVVVPKHTLSGLSSRFDMLVGGHV
jgi:hypothetical protein